MTKAEYLQKLRAIRMDTAQVKGKLEAANNTLATNRSMAHPMRMNPPSLSPVPTASTLSFNTGDNQMTNQQTNLYLKTQMSQIQKKLDLANQNYAREAQVLREAQSRLRGGLVSNRSAKDLKFNTDQSLKDLGLAPGNIGDINRVIWPFWFTTTEAILAPDRSVQGTITITQEAAFVWMSTVKCVFVERPPVLSNTWDFIDPAQPDSSGKSTGLTYTVRDSQSSREFHNIPQAIDMIGTWEDPTPLHNPSLFLPNSNIEWNFQNNNASLTYKVFAVMFGYRVRVDHAKDILGTIVG